MSDGSSALRHPSWVRVTHWLAASSIVVLAVTGLVILAAHPRLYWGDVGNDLTPALIELPISRNHRHGGWTPAEAITPRPGGPVTANRTFVIFNQNAWGRSLHFLAAWVMVATGGLYLCLGLFTGHVRRRVAPRRDDLRIARVVDDLRRHARLGVASAPGAYGTLQRWAYTGVVFVLLPFAVLTGLAMSPAITAAAPFLLTMFGGMQSARTLHFVAWVATVGFATVHVVMVATTGLRRHLRAMTLGD